jgi:beta-lactamase superfamily II metal-dependent hydrolase
MSDKNIQLRMYNVGFGDCFLFRIPTASGERRVLVDCGYHSQGQGEYSDKDLVKQIAADLNGEPLHVVVATHRHQDHISGFGEPELWKNIGVEEVWLPFTADPKAAEDEPSLAAWDALRASVEGVFKKDKLTPEARTALGARPDGELAAVEFMLWNARANAPGIENLLTGMRRKDGQKSYRRFLPDPKKKYPSRFKTPILPGVTVHVLGPPTDPALRKNKKVPSEWAFVDAAPTGSKGAPPFSEVWLVPQGRVPGDLPFKPSSYPSIRMFNDDLLNAAKALEGFLNGESLVLLLEFGKARLLLTGDAEVGAWVQILGNPKALALASSATFLKVGHHGSHNATPLDFIKDHLAEATPAVISTQEGDGSFRNGIQFGELLAKMTARKMPYARSDEPPAKSDAMFTPDKKKRWVDVVSPC